jgi:hypothetical protein
VAAATHAAPLRVDVRPAVPTSAPAAVSEAAAAPFGGLERVSWKVAEAGGLWVVLELDGALPSEGLRRFRPAAGPPREVIQLLGARRGYEPSVLQVHSPLLEQIRVGFHPGGGDELLDELRVVLDLPTATVAVRRVEREGSAVRILLADVADEQTTATTNEIARASLNTLPADRPANQAASALAAVPVSTLPQ